MVPFSQSFTSKSMALVAPNALTFEYAMTNARFGLGADQLVVDRAAVVEVEVLPQRVDRARSAGSPTGCDCGKLLNCSGREEVHVAVVGQEDLLVGLVVERELERQPQAPGELVAVQRATGRSRRPSRTGSGAQACPKSSSLRNRTKSWSTTSSSTEPMISASPDSVQPLARRAERVGADRQLQASSRRWRSSWPAGPACRPPVTCAPAMGEPSSADGDRAAHREPRQRARARSPGRWSRR